MKALKLHLVRVSPCCRVVWLYLLQNEIPFELIDVDIFARINDKSSKFELADGDHRRLPIIEDEQKSIVGIVPCLRHLDIKYPERHKGWHEDPLVKSKIYNILEWAAAELHSLIGYQLVYPQFLGTSQENDLNVKEAMKKTVGVLESMEKKYFARDSKFMICVSKPTVADFYVATVIIQLEWMESIDMKLWPSIHSWLNEIQKQEHWDTVHAKHVEFVKSLKNVPLELT
ncbi:uncharacterized protein LOC124436563 [Xenia sp. Carnegie-2017]|uniref:uncharacterized protein LOC124436563 n=1 Tax=Xenia sp. Carnegie-2017 TaxID=2897299 RepID=UPI001F035860|nr:uncharacterized protein LOC124436563 [Xenia sp. Carnegie-2017]